MKSTKTILTNPCSENWGNMALNDNGRFCGRCKKTVVDFTAWKDDDIKKYLQEQSGTTCGHFNKSQVEVIRPRHHQFLVDLYFRIKENIRIPVLKTIALQLIIVSMLVIGCNTPENQNESGTDDKKKEGSKIDSTNKTTGMIAPPDFPHSPISPDTTKIIHSSAGNN
jgi:hypothetical protein